MTLAWVETVGGALAYLVFMVAASVVKEQGEDPFGWLAAALTAVCLCLVGLGRLYDLGAVS